MSSCSEDAKSAIGETKNTPSRQAGNTVSNCRDTGLNASWYLRIALAFFISLIAIFALIGTVSASHGPPSQYDCYNNNPGKTALEQLNFCATGHTGGGVPDVPPLPAIRSDDSSDKERLVNYGLYDIAVGTKEVTTLEKAAKLSKEMKDVLPKIGGIFKELAGRNGIITSTWREKDPKRRSYHHDGAEISNATDWRINDLTDEKKAEIFKRLHKELGGNLDACLEVPDTSKFTNFFSSVKVTAKATNFFFDKEKKEQACVLTNPAPHIHVEYERGRAEWTKKLGPLATPPPPIVFNHEVPGEEEPAGTPSLLNDLASALNARQILYEEEFFMPAGLDVRVTTSAKDIAKDIAIWAAQIVGKGVGGKIAASLIPADKLKTIEQELTILSQAKAVYDISQLEPQVSGDYAVGPFTIEVRYLPELIPDGYSKDDVGLFHAVVSGGKTVLTQVKSSFNDKVNSLLYGRVEGFSIYIVGILKTSAPTVSPSVFNFSLSVTPASHTASAGQKEEATYKISLQTLMGQTNDLVWLEASGIPPNSATWLGPCIGCRVPYESRLEVRPASNTPPGRYDITITAKTLPRGPGDKGIIHSQRVTLIVEERPTFKISVTPFSPQEMTEGGIQGAGWTFNVVWKGKPEPVSLIVGENIDIITDPPGFEKLRRDSLRGQWVGQRNITLGQAAEESLRLSINFDRLPNDIGHKYPISSVQITLKAVRSDGTTEFIPLPPLKVLSCNANWSAALPANKLLEQEMNLGRTPEGSRLVLPPDPNFKGRDVERRSFDEEARSPILVYRPSAPQIGSWLKVGPIFPTNPNELRWEWSNPNGEIVKNFKKSLPPQPNRCTYWTSYSEMDTLDKDLWVPGLWKVKVFLDEELKGTQLFRIEAPPAPTPTLPPPPKQEKRGGFSCASLSQAYNGPNSPPEKSDRSAMVLSILVVAASATFLSLRHWR